LPSLAQTNTWKEPGITQRDELLRAVDRVLSTPAEPVWGRDGDLFIKLPTSPVFPTSPAWSPTQHEDVVVMQQSQREAWKSLGRRFDAAHDEDATSPHHANARGRRSSMSLPRTSSDPLPATRAQGRRASLPEALLGPREVAQGQRHTQAGDQRQISPLRSPAATLSGDTKPFRQTLQLRSPTAALQAEAVVRGQSRGSPLGLASTRLGPRHMFARQMRRFT